MKRELLKQTATALLIAITALAGCKKEDEPANIMTMTTAMEGEVTFVMACITESGLGEAVIDWGDGSKETVTLSTVVSTAYSHTFSGTTSRTIAIDGQNITFLNCGELQLTALDVSNNTALENLWCNDNQITAIDVTKNTALTGLYCYNNQLTSLDVTENTALTWLDCRSNQLTAEGLNALFGTLHSNSGVKYIVIENNPGSAGCDRSIAEGKGWTVI